MARKTPTIAIVIETKVKLGFNPLHLVEVLQRYVDECVGPAWGVAAHIVLRKEPLATDWVMEILTRSDVEGAEGYHDVTSAGLPHMKIFVDDTKEAGDLLTVCAAHELAEGLVDELVNLCADPGNGEFVGLENCDPVEADQFWIDGLAMSNFVYPQYFNPDAPAGARLDHLGLIKKPFEIRPGGYLPVFKDGEWTQETIDEEGEKAAAKSGRMRKRSARGLTGAPQAPRRPRA